jgi:5'-phosphate synthase pdxT subunit
MSKIIGVLAIQGDYQAHIDMARKIGVKSIEVKTIEDLSQITHLIIPGGETTTIHKIIGRNGLWDKISNFKGPVLGTCMGSILMSEEITEPSGVGLGMLDIKVARNAYGRQVNSFIENGRIEFDDEPFEMVFIRAPKFLNYGVNVRPIAWLNDEVTGVMAGNKIAVTFHPELSDDVRIHKYFMSLPAE